MFFSLSFHLGNHVLCTRFVLLAMPVLLLFFLLLRALLAQRALNHCDGITGCSPYGGKLQNHALRVVLYYVLELAVSITILAN